MPDQHAELPNPFRCESGELVQLPVQWRSRRQEIQRTVLETGYGGQPHATLASQEELHCASARQFGGARILSLRVTLDLPGHFSFPLRLWVPDGAGLFPVVLTGDACWAYANDRVVAEVLRRGYVLAQFNRVELACDAGHARRDAGIYPYYPGLRFGAVSAWAWGYQRCLDVLQKLAFVDASKMAVIGHSRGGKAALLAGAIDERIALTCANNSGAGGAGCYRWLGPQCETLADLVRAFAHWMGPQLGEFAGREHELPFDQHFLKALVAPRALLTTEALDDLWANPQGTWQTHLAAREVYRFLGAQDNIAVTYRPGGHDHGEADWCTFLDFADAVFHRQTEPALPANASPFPGLPPAFGWRRPDRSSLL